MLVIKPKEQFPDRKVESLEVRKKRHAIEAPQAMKDYLRAQQVARERMAALRQERLAREAAKET
jgi:hypothetical protein